MASSNTIRVEYQLEIDQEKLTPEKLASIKNELVQRVAADAVKGRASLSFIKFIRKAEGSEGEEFEI